MEEILPSYALYGLPGVGKTALASAVARHKTIKEYFIDGILWANMGPGADIQSQLQRWGHLLGLRSLSNGKPLSLIEQVRLIRTAIGIRRILIVIDDVWKAEEALGLQIGGPHCVYLLTTRFPQLSLQVANHNTIYIPELQEKEALELLASFTPEFIKHEPKIARGLVHSAGSLPLALTIIGQHLQIHAHNKAELLNTAKKIIKDRAYRLQLPNLATEKPVYSAPSPNTSYSLQSVIALSELKLSTKARHALRAISIFPTKPDSFTEEASRAVSQQSVEILDELSDAGLIDSSGAGSYTLHSTIADYAYYQLGECEPIVQRRLVEYAIRYIEKYKNDDAALDRESSTLLFALEIAWQQKRYTDLIQGTTALIPFLYKRGLYHQLEELLKRSQQAMLHYEDFPASKCIELALERIAHKPENDVQSKRPRQKDRTRKLHAEN